MGSNTSSNSNQTTNRISQGLSTNTTNTIQNTTNNTITNINNDNNTTTDREKEQYLNWQKEMEFAFKTLLRSIKPYFSDWSDSDVLLSLQNDINDSSS